MAKKLKIDPNKLSSTLTGNAFQTMKRAWNTITNSCLLVLLQVIIEPEMRFNAAVIQFKVLL